ncbi:TBC1 domain family member 22A isoform X1 [Tachysurus ichikawai]
MILLLCFVCCCQAEPEGFSHFHLYVCAAFLVHWRKEILEEKDFQVPPHLNQHFSAGIWGRNNGAFSEL